MEKKQNNVLGTQSSLILVLDTSLPHVTELVSKISELEFDRQTLSDNWIFQGALYVSKPDMVLKNCTGSSTSTSFPSKAPS